MSRAGAGFSERELLRSRKRFLVGFWLPLQAVATGNRTVFSADEFWATHDAFDIPLDSNIVELVSASREYSITRLMDQSPDLLQIYAQ